MIGKLYIKTKSPVSIDVGRFSELYLSKDVPVDPRGLPYIPLNSALREIIGENSADCILGIARLENYQGLLSGLKLTDGLQGFSKKAITEIYTTILKDSKGETYQAIRSGLKFVADIEIRDEKKDSIVKKLESIKQIGFVNDVIQGLVKISIDWNSQAKSNEAEKDLPQEKVFKQLDYTLEVRSPLCIYSPYEKSTKAKSFIPGGELLKFIQKNVSAEEWTILSTPELRCSFAYPSHKQRRGIPAPICMAVEKLNKSNLWYKLSTEPKGNRMIQTVGLSGDYVTRLDRKTVTRFSVEYVSIFPVKAKKEDLCGSKGSRDAIQEGQTFKGAIYGNDDQIRILYKLFKRKPVFNLGFYIDEGYGSVSMHIDQVDEKMNIPALYANAFDLFTLSPVVMFDSRGMFVYNSKALLERIEKLLGVKDVLQIQAELCDSEYVYSLNENIEFCASTIKSMIAGCSFRIKTKDGSMIDISPLKGAFVGERTNEGFGEIRAYPPYEEFFRICEECETDSYSFVAPQNSQDLQAMSHLNQEVLKHILFSKFAHIALLDSKDATKDKDVPIEILIALSKKYAPYLSIAELESMYKEAQEYVAG